MHLHMAELGFVISSRFVKEGITKAGCFARPFEPNSFHGAQI
jgi:hypothetical protein